MQKYVTALGQVLAKPHISSQRINNYLQSQNVPFRYLFKTSTIQRESNFKSEARKKEFTVKDLLQHINNGRPFYLKQLTNIFHTIDFNSLKSDEAILLLKFCGSSIPDSSRDQRIRVCQDIFNSLQKNNKLNIDIYNTYFKACSENNVAVNCKDFLCRLNGESNKETFKLLLENVCQLGNISDALLILEHMKDNEIPVNTDTFNYLILAHAIQGGLESAEKVLNTMRSAQIPENNSTKLVLITGLIRRNDFKGFKKVLEEYPLKYAEHELLSIIKELGLVGNESWLSEIHKFYKDLPVTRDFQTELEKICIHLIRMGQPLSAMNIYKEFILPVPETSYGYILLKDMLLCNTDIKTIISLAKDLVEKEYNEYILESLTDIALKFQYIEAAWALLGSLKTLRPHYFWPLLVHGGKMNEANGVFSVLTNMKDLNVKPDAETLEKYVIWYCDLSNLKLLVVKLQGYGLSVREILSPLIIVLLKEGRSRQAVNICNLYNVSISGDKLFQLLSTAWGSTKDTTSILYLLRRYCESNITGQDLVGIFLIECCKLCKHPEEFKEFVQLVKVIGENRLKIGTSSGDILQALIKNCSDENLKSKMETSINLILDFGLKLAEDVSLTHPKNMDIAGLECHLIELQEKNMGVRGVLRKLILMHANQGNIARVTELRQLFLEYGCKDSAGMRSSLLHSYVLGGHLDEATSLYEELKTYNPDFTLDSYKFIDLAKLFFENNRFDEGYSLLQYEVPKSKTFGNTKAIERNCRELLNACKSEEEIYKVFDLLLKSGLCKPVNTILGPLVRVHLQNGDLNKAVHTYTELSRKYRCTPLQLEVMCAVSKQENSELLQKVIRATEAVHGTGPTQLGLISAFAENGQEKPLKKLLNINNVPIRPLVEKRCERWVKEGKIDPLKCLLKACDRLPEEIVNLHFIYKCIFDLYDFNGDYAGALEFYESMPEESTLRIHFEKDLQRILAKCDANRIENLKIGNKL